MESTYRQENRVSERPRAGEEVALQLVLEGVESLTAQRGGGGREGGRGFLGRAASCSERLKLSVSGQNGGG